MPRQRLAATSFFCSHTHVLTKTRRKAIGWRGLKRALMATHPASVDGGRRAAVFWPHWHYATWMRYALKVPVSNHTRIHTHRRTTSGPTRWLMLRSFEWDYMGDVFLWIVLTQPRPALLFSLKCDATQPRHGHHGRRYTCLPGPEQKVGQCRGLVLIKLSLNLSSLPCFLKYLNFRGSFLSERNFSNGHLVMFFFFQMSGCKTPNLKRRKNCWSRQYCNWVGKIQPKLWLQVWRYKLLHN